MLTLSMFDMLSTTTYLLIIGVIVGVVLILVDHARSIKRKRTLARVIIEDGEAPDTAVKNKQILRDPPGPVPYPITGSIHLLGQYDVPYKAFAYLTKKYNSQVIKLRVGSVPCVVVNGLENIKEVLFAKGQHFDSRPNFVRYNKLFAGNKENSLAFCDWSEIQKSRREMLRNHTFPRAFTYQYNQLNVIIASEVENLLAHLDKPLGTMKVAVKPLVLNTCANIFTSYFCSRRFEFGDMTFRQMVQNFDRVFYEVNQGYAADFMPFLMIMHAKNMSNVANWTQKIRQFVEDKIVEDRLKNWTEVIPEKDYMDCLINHIKSNAEPKMSWETALFALEDIIGGHSAIGNFLVKVFGFLATRRHIQEIAQKEIDEVKITGNTVGLEHRHSMPYTEAILLEAIRLIASPIVPHVANRDTSVAGFKVDKNTFIFLNNYELNMSADLWDTPTEFMPTRFIKEGRISKPEYFLPFGGGRRSCMGYKMVQYLSFSILASILKNYTIAPIEEEVYKVPVGSLALPETTFSFRFERR
ncbi:cytochrome P450 307a1-like [Chelonus insularis]|uniref:cytochrome P450 307a1-like n=1 Tax=Chelonus insularis TaxID=460826 RepID=UPI00158B64E8|nr:cytochrome P450 307a1-like [Chelonus insularis]